MRNEIVNGSLATFIIKEERLEKQGYKVVIVERKNMGKQNCKVLLLRKYTRNMNVMQLK